MLRDYIIGTAIATLIIYLTVAELDRREAHSRLVSRMQSFMATGPRFTRDQGRTICEALRSLQVEHDYVRPINCNSLLGGE